MSQKSKFEQVVLAISQKDVTEAIFKNLSAFFACAAVLKYCANATIAKDIPFAAASFLVFVSLLTINFIYSVHHIIIPIEKALPKNTTQQIPDEIGLFREMVVFMATRASGLLYFLFSCGFSWFVFRLIDYVAGAK